MVMEKTQLLCSFTTVADLDKTLHQIVNNYDVAFDTIYVLENVDVSGSLCCTYNISLGGKIGTDIPSATISLHRKKATNTLYTINALNLLVAELNGGKQDKNFELPWQNYRNTILVTAYQKLKKINTKLNKIVKTTDLNATS
jgi:hypothetical protein